MKSIQYIVACCAVLIFTTTAFEQDSKPSNLSEREKQLIYSRAYESIQWGSPALAIIAMDESAKRDLGAANTDIIYSAKSMDHRWELVTYNNQSPYWNASFSVKDGPIVVEMLPVFGDPWFLCSYMLWGSVSFYRGRF